MSGVMTSRTQIAANRRNARKSTGPKSVLGRSRSSRNALRHGLAVPVEADPHVRDEVKKLAKAIAAAAGLARPGEAAHSFAEAEFDLLRIRKLRSTVFNEAGLIDFASLNDKLSKIARYERRAFSRRKRALRSL
jgi:enoyl-CoA hydratase/carnithine racemase